MCLIILALFTSLFLQSWKFCVNSVPLGKKVVFYLQPVKNREIWKLVKMKTKENCLDWAAAWKSLLWMLAYVLLNAKNALIVQAVLASGLNLFRNVSWRCILCWDGKLFVCFVERNLIFLGKLVINARYTCGWNFGLVTYWIYSQNLVLDRKQNRAG